MKAIKLYLGLLFLATLTACSKNESSSNEDFISFLKDRPYTGEAKAVLHRSGYDSLPSVNGVASFSVAKDVGDSVMVVLRVDISESEGFTMGIPGSQSGRAWNANFNDGAFSIKNNGEIKGNIVAGDKEITWDGRLFDDKVMMDVRIKYLQAEGDITEGSILATNLNLSRSGPNAGGGEGNHCEHIVWETRPVFNLYSGGVDLISVPVCH